MFVLLLMDIWEGFSNPILENNIVSFTSFVVPFMTVRALEPNMYTIFVCRFRKTSEGSLLVLIVVGGGPFAIVSLLLSLPSSAYTTLESESDMYTIFVSGLTVKSNTFLSRVISVSIIFVVPSMTLTESEPN